MLEADFFEVSDEFVNLANEMLDEWAQPMLSAAIMHAAARFNAFHVLDQGEEQDLSKAIGFLTSQYRQMLEEAIREMKRDGGF
ncbi:DUF3144 domain-containing protein [Marinobacterium sp. D7]|uniref:DUF3144 domain-containing protein n=1 Tax=Marinobacterium ramblicola TaxID=2849041 RepID=UPI001C2D29DF|nr:DUF3144 domain-containing protein [Marinobacterium ramblicola]MBV1790753.1 DUF3144 domain-containing protein [Marinobacterium ramblicola]